MSLTTIPIASRKEIEIENISSPLTSDRDWTLDGIVIKSLREVIKSWSDYYIVIMIRFIKFKDLWSQPKYKGVKVKT